MSTPVLTKKQQRKSLSGKKGPVKGLRNILAQPQQVYWPVLKLDQCKELENIFKESTSCMKRESERMPWSQLKKLTKEERSEIRKKEREKRKAMPNKEIMESVVTGTNAVTRALEKNRICSILLDANIDPPLLVKHIVMMAQNKKIPIVLVPFLRSASLESIGFTCIAFALKDMVCKASDHHFHLLYNKIQEHFSKLLPPDRTPETFDEIEDKQENKCNIPISSNDSSNTKEKEDEPKKSKDFILSTNVYKYRTSVKERVFVPLGTKPDNDHNKGGFSDFICLGGSDDEIETNTKVIPKRGRYIDIHDTKSKKSDEGSDLDHSKQTNVISVRDNDTSSEMNEVKLTDAENDIEREICISKSNGTKRKMSNVSYKSLKIKRVQGNNNRIKATKVLKKKKAV